MEQKNTPELRKTIKSFVNDAFLKYKSSFEVTEDEPEVESLKVKLTNQNFIEIVTSIEEEFDRLYVEYEKDNDLYIDFVDAFIEKNFINNKDLQDISIVPISELVFLGDGEESALTSVLFDLFIDKLNNDEFKINEMEVADYAELSVNKQIELVNEIMESVWYFEVFSVDEGRVFENKESENEFAQRVITNFITLINSIDIISKSPLVKYAIETSKRNIDQMYGKKYDLGLEVGKDYVDIPKPDISLEPGIFSREEGSLVQDNGDIKTQTARDASMIHNYFTEDMKIELEGGNIIEFDKQNEVSSLYPFENSDKDEIVLLKLLYNPDIMKAIEFDLDIDLKQMSLSSQIHFLRYLSGQDNKTFVKIREVLKNNKENSNIILQAFLGASQGFDKGDKIIEIVEKFDKTQSKNILLKYNNIISGIKEIENQVKSIEDININKIVKNIISSANKFLEDISEKSSEDITEELELIHSKVLWYVSFVKVVKEQGIDIGLGDFENSELQEKQSNELSDNEKTAITQIYKNNYKHLPEFQKYLIDNLDKVFNNKKTKWNILKFEDEIIAFMRFDDIGKNELYFGSFNLDQNAKGVSIGEEMMLKILDEKAQDNVIIAEAVIGDKITSNYINRGFIGTGVNIVEGVPLLKIERNEQVYAKQNESIEVLKDKQGYVYKEVKENELKNTLQEMLNGSMDLVRYEISGKKHKLLFEDVNVLQQAA